MRTAALLTLAGLGLTGCSNDYQITTATRPDVELALDLYSPTYGEFLGDEAIAVTGKVVPAYAVVEIEGERVEVAADGSFVASLPVDGPYRIVDVDARVDTQEVRERVPVFSGLDPAETWPGGLTGRFLPKGMARLGEELGAFVDTLGWADQLSAVLPDYSGSVITLTSLGVSHDPTVVEITPARDGMQALASLRNVTVNYELYVPLISYTETLSVGFERIAVGGLLIPLLDDDGLLSLQLDDAQIDLDEPIFDFGFLQGWLFDIVVGAVNEWVIEPLGEVVLDLVLDQFGAFELGGPFAFEFDLLGTPLSFALTDLYGEELGLGLEAGIGLGEPVSEGRVELPLPDETTPGAEDADLSVALHEGLFQVLMGDALLPMLGDFDLGEFAPLIGTAITTLPGGEQAPAGAVWCLDFDPGTAYAARLQESTNPLAVVYFPDFVLDVGIAEGGGVCNTWLKASLATEIAFGLDGTALDLDISMPEGAVLEYGAEGVDEDELIAELGSFIAGSIGLVAGGLLDIDLADLLGELDTGVLGVLEPEVVGSSPLVDPENPDLHGLYALSLTLWAD